MKDTDENKSVTRRRFLGSFSSKLVAGLAAATLGGRTRMWLKRRPKPPLFPEGSIFTLATKNSKKQT